MAIAPTPNNSLFKGFVFDGVDSRDYGVYISGDAVFNAPERDVEMIEIPGRNGAFALDKGRFSNIEVTYPAGLFGNSEADFAAGINALRNALASRKGYCRLEDDYNPNEYRMAVYKSGLDVTPARLKAGEFDIVFDCKPQRFLKSGETAVSVTSGGTITNPTLFEAHPLLAFDATQGNATILINDDTINFENKDVGDVIVTGQRTGGISTDWFNSYNFDQTSLLNTGDVITMGTFSLYLTLRKPRTSDDYIYDLDSVTVTSSNGLRYVSNTSTYIDNTYRFDTNTSISFPYRGAASDRTVDIYLTFKFKKAGYSDLTVSGVHVSVLFSYTSYNNVRLKYGYENSNTGMLNTYARYSCAETTGYSTKPTLSGTMYFDLDIGEAYRYESGEPVAINDVASFGADLPALIPGDNIIGYTGGLTNVKITPRWWEV